MNKTFISALALAGVATGLSACGLSGSDAEGSDGPLKVAVVATSSGPLAKFGEDTLTAIQYATDEVNAAGGVDGHKVELVVVETDGTPAQTVASVRKAVSQQGARFITGVLSSPEQIAVQPLLKSLGAVSIAYVSDDVLRGELCSANAFMTSPSSSMSLQAVAQGLPQEDLAGTWAISAVDVSSGHLAVDNFIKAVKAAGGSVKAAEYSPSGTTDFGPQVTKLKASGAEHLFVAQYGADGVAFVNQADQFGLFDDMKAVVGSNMISEPLFEALGDKIVGFYNDVRYSPTIDTPQNKEFVERWRDKEDADLYYITAGNYTAMQTLFAGVEEAGSTDPQKVAGALDGLTVDTIFGDATMRAEDHQLLVPTYLGRVEKVDGELAFSLVSSLPASDTTPEPDPACEL